jgi:hypothetical protein
MRAREPIVHHNREVSRARSVPRRCESAARDSIKKPVLASADETRSRSARKFFYCQKSRLRVRAGRFSATSRRVAASRARRSLNVRLTKIPVVQAIPAILTSACGGLARTIRIVVQRPCRVVASRAPTSRRQHFLKRDAVFFNVLVYSGWVHFDSRVHAAIKSSHLGGQHGQES